MPMLGGCRRFESQEAEGSPIDSLFRDDDNQPRRGDTRQILRASVERLKTSEVKESAGWNATVLT